jgi:hypothetical protein
VKSLNNFFVEHPTALPNAEELTQGQQSNAVKSELKSLSSVQAIALITKYV